MANQNISSRNVICWNLPSAPTVKPIVKNGKSKRNIMDTPMMPINPNKKVRSSINSSTVIGGAASVAMLSTTTTANAQVQISSSGVFLPIFLEHIFPLMLDVAAVYVVIKVAMDFYKEQRSGGNGGDDLGLGTVLKNGKWLLLFYLIPFFIKLLEQLGTQMANKVGG